MGSSTTPSRPNFIPDRNPFPAMAMLWGIFLGCCWTLRALLYKVKDIRWVLLKHWFIAQRHWEYMWYFKPCKLSQHTENRMNIVQQCLLSWFCFDWTTAKLLNIYQCMCYFSSYCSIVYVVSSLQLDSWLLRHHTIVSLTVTVTYMLFMRYKNTQHFN